MKKLLMLLTVACCFVAWSIPASAVEMEYGGYWRVRSYSMNGFTGDSDDSSLDKSQIDSRGRLWTKMIINDEMSWTNRVEFNVIWGDELNGGGIATDGTNYLRFKHSYVDLDLMKGDAHLRMGLQGAEIATGLLFDDDFAGVTATYLLDDNKLNFIWMKAYEGGVVDGEYQEDLDGLDVDFFGLAPNFTLADGQLALNPFIFYLTSDDGREWSSTTGNEDIDVAYIGLDLTYSINETSNVWGAFIYEAGTADVVDSDVSYDISAFLVAAGAEVGLDDAIDGLSVHGQAFYATGDDDLDDEDLSSFYVPRGQSYYWSEIMGMGMFDSVTSYGSPGDTLCNIWAVNLGIGYQINEDLKAIFDLWHAELAETNDQIEDTDLGTEADLRLDYTINEDLILSLVGAYLFPGEASDYNLDDGEGVWEVGMQLTFTFASED